MQIKFSDPTAKLAGHHSLISSLKIALCIQSVVCVTSAFIFKSINSYAELPEKTKIFVVTPFKKLSWKNSSFVLELNTAIGIWVRHVKSVSLGRVVPL